MLKTTQLLKRISGTRPKSADTCRLCPHNVGVGFQTMLSPFAVTNLHAQMAVVQLNFFSTIYLADNEKMLSDYGTTFVAAWKNTHNYRVWNSNKHPALSEINPK